MYKRQQHRNVALPIIFTATKITKFMKLLQKELHQTLFLKVQLKEAGEKENLPIKHLGLKYYRLITLILPDLI